jgi:DNA-binding transcriptional MerR regulator
MLIGEVSKKTGFSKDTIRFYEKIGLIEISHRERRPNNYKEYSERIIDRLQTIKNLKDFGFTLNETKELIQAWEMGIFDCSDEMPRMLDKIRSIENQIRNLKLIKESLERSIQNCPEDCNIVNALEPISRGR